MSIISALAALLPLLSKLLDLFTKSPDEKIQDVQKSLLRYIEDVSIALDKAKESKGDTSELDRILNHRR